MEDPADQEPALSYLEDAPAYRLNRFGRLASFVSAAAAQVNWRKVGIFIASLFLFILAIVLMKEGARDLAPLVRDRFRVTNAANSLGFGW